MASRPVFCLKYRRTCRTRYCPHQPTLLLTVWPSGLGSVWKAKSVAFLIAESILGVSRYVSRHILFHSCKTFSRYDPECLVCGPGVKKFFKRTLPRCCGKWWCSYAPKTIAAHNFFVKLNLSNNINFRMRSKVAEVVNNWRDWKSFQIFWGWPSN